MLPLSESVAAGPSVSIDFGADGPKQTTVVIQILILLTVLSLAPALFIMVTSFTRIVIVLAFLRQALGTQSVPPNQVLLSLALFLTMFIMAPVGQAVYNNALQPLMAEQISYEDAWKKGIEPVRNFMLRQVREKDLELFIKLSHVPKPDRVEDVPTQAIIPAFILGELQCISDWVLNYIPFHRGYGRCEHSYVDGHDAASACRDLAAVQVDLVRLGRWLVLGRGVNGEKFSLGLSGLLIDDIGWSSAEKRDDHVTPEMVTELARQALETTLLVS